MPRWPEISTEERLLQNVWPDLRTQCWLWMGYCNPNGYGTVKVNRKQMLAHRAFFEVFTGPIPEGLTIDHLCRVRHCVNPDHLEAVSQKENILRGVGPTAKNAEKMHCPQGHPYSGENLYLKGGKKRNCRICARASYQKWRTKQKALRQCLPEIHHG